MMKATFTGVIGNKGLKPKMTWDFRKRQGRTVKVPFIRFSMFCEDLTQAPQMNPTTGRMERPKEIVQVILPESERGQKLFQSLGPGRQVTVTGRFNTTPGVGKNGEGNEQLYSNIKVYMDDLQFNDSPIERQALRVLKLQQAAGILTENQVKEQEEGINAYLAAQAEQHGPPREVEDRTYQGNKPKDESSPDNSEKPNNESNPDEPGF